MQIITNNNPIKKLPIKKLVDVSFMVEFEHNTDVLPVYIKFKDMPYPDLAKMETNGDKLIELVLGHMVQNPDILNYVESYFGKDVIWEIADDEATLSKLVTLGEFAVKVSDVQTLQTDKPMLQLVE